MSKYCVCVCDREVGHRFIMLTDNCERRADDRVLTNVKYHLIHVVFQVKKTKGICSKVSVNACNTLADSLQLKPTGVTSLSMRKHVVLICWQT